MAKESHGGDVQAAINENHLELELGLDSNRKNLENEKQRLNVENKHRRRSVLKLQMDFKKDAFNRKIDGSKIIHSQELQDQNDLNKSNT